MATQKQDLLNRMYTWQDRNDGTFSFNAAWLRKDIGRNSTQVVRSMFQDKLLQLVEYEQFFPDTTRKGRSRRYRLTPEASRQSVTVITTQDNEYFRTRDRTNMAGIGYLTEGKDGDTRHYTDFSQLKSAEKSKVTIDNEPLVEIDISNCHLLPLPPLLRRLRLNKNERDLCDSILAGTVYDELAEWTGFDRKKIIKPALLKILNSPYDRVHFSKWVQELGVSYYETTEDEEKAQFQRMFKRAFPRVYAFFRHLGKTRSSYLLGVEYEGKIRRQVQKRFLKKFGYQPLDCHDGFFAKESDYHRFMSILYKVARDIPVKVSRFSVHNDIIKTQSGLISHLYVQRLGEIVPVNPRAELFFVFDDGGSG